MNFTLSIGDIVAIVEGVIIFTMLILFLLTKMRGNRNRSRW